MDSRGIMSVLTGNLNILFLCCLVANGSHYLQNYQVVGEGNMYWYIFNLYNAKLLTPSGYYKKNNWPVALELSYNKNIKKDNLIRATESEWKRMEISYLSQWLITLNDIWPSVNSGDRLTLHIDNCGNSHFYYNDNLIGSINNAEFSRAFLTIWLSEKSHNQSLRKKLTGVNKAG